MMWNVVMIKWQFYYDIIKYIIKDVWIKIILTKFGIPCGI